MILAELRKSTAPIHHEVESRVDLLSPTLTVDRYVRILQAFHAFFTGLDQVLEANCPARFRELWLGRRPVTLLAADLETLHAGPDPDVEKRFIPPELRSEGDWLGALYVVEGSALGGQAISRYLEQHFGWRNGEGYSFFRGHAEQTAARWRRVCGVLEGSAEVNNQILNGAHLTFNQLNRCLLQSL